MKNLKKSDENCICVFDSGIGGLTVMHECVKRLPSYNFVYFADNYNVPYGNKSQEEIRRLAFSTFEKIKRLHPKAAVVACNTVTAVCIEDLRSKYTFPIVGIQPAIKPAAKYGGRCLVLATKATAESQALKKLIISSGVVDPIICPCEGLADFIEENILHLPDSLPKHLLPDLKCDCVVLGCTHYSFVKKLIEKAYNCPILDGNVGTADHLAKIVGMSDHIGKNEQKIKFCGGNFKKNGKIFDKLNEWYYT